MRQKIGAGVAAVALSAGIIGGTAAPANAIDGVYYLHSSWVEAVAEMNSFTNYGTWRAYAQLGGTVKWGASSTTHTAAIVQGFNTTHQARLYLNGGIWKSAQS
ncbi:hypothetical protein RN50_01035 [Microbacterium foliorum]|uniref:Lactococcin 972 family bacteriocin n=1 Tax=Microbacterium foliorum TaxID=104336 RepID=A0A0F0KUD2_9MICO|nr:hypothetical protein RN50_01035 [Microbacterium foliorum]